MDTRLKKFNSTLILKTVAILLCLSCVLNCTNQLITSLYKIEENNISEYTYEDALHEILLIKKDTTETETFRRHIRDYSELLSYMTGTFGDGSEGDYRQWKEILESTNNAYYEKAKNNLINHVVADEFRSYLELVSDGVVIPLGIIGNAEYSGNTVNIYDYSINRDDIPYDYLCNEKVGNVVRYSTDDAIKKKAVELGAVGVFELNNYYQIITEDNYNEEEKILESYKPGYYAFKIDEDAFEDKLVKYGLYSKDDYGSAKEFAKCYKMYEDTMKEKYPSGRYFIRDGSGRVFTNVKGLSVKSSKKDVESKFAAFGFYCQEKDYGDIYLPDGSYYTNGGFDNYNGDYYIVPTTTMTPTEAATLESTTFKVPVETTVAQISTQVSGVTAVNDSTPFVNEGSEDWLCMFGVDMSEGAYSATDLFRTTEIQIEAAKEIITDAIYTAAVLGVLFVVCFVYLIVRAGRRRGSKEVYLMKTDAMFTDWRIAVDGLLGFGVVMLFFFAADEFYDYDTRIFALISSLLAVLFAALVLDLVLFITRHIKARSLFKNLFPVWLIRKGWGVYKKKIKPVLDEKFLYTKELSKGTLVRIGLVAIINIVLVFFGTMEAVDNYTCFLFVLCLLFDIGVLAWAIRLVAGLHKIFSALDEIRNGNYNVHINTASLPATLRASALKVMGLRDGLKTAVDEAVRQEQTKTELITNVSHDLKTPLTSIINYVELLKKCQPGDPDAKEYLDVLGEKSDRLKKLIEDLVEASKASTGNIKVDIVEVSLNEMVSQLLGEHADGLERKKLNVVVEFPENELTVKADGKLLYRVMENLIVNVEKYSLYGTRVYVTVRKENGCGTVTFKNISEQPLNISAEQLKERFVRGDESRSTEGNGLGLSIAQSLCDVQNGELEISISGDLFTAKVRLKK